MLILSYFLVRFPFPNSSARLLWDLFTLTAIAEGNKTCACAQRGKMRQVSTNIGSLKACETSSSSLPVSRRTWRGCATFTQHVGFVQLCLLQHSMDFYVDLVFELPSAIVPKWPGFYLYLTVVSLTLLDQQSVMGSDCMPFIWLFDFCESKLSLSVKFHKETLDSMLLAQ